MKKVILNSDKMKKIGVLGCGWLGKQFVAKTHDKYKLSATNTTKVEGTFDNVDHFVVNLPETWDQDFFDQINELIISISPSAESFMKSIDLLISTIGKNDNIEKIILWSTIGVYGNRKGIIDEDFTAKPERSTAQKMLEAENKLLEFFKDKLVILRLGGLVGVKRHPGHFFKENHPIKRSHDRINLVHAEDVIAITEKVIDGEIKASLINVVTPYHPQKKEFYHDAMKDVDRSTIQMDAKGETRIVHSYVLEDMDYQFIHLNLSDWSCYK